MMALHFVLNLCLLYPLDFQGRVKMRTFTAAVLSGAGCEEAPLHWDLYGCLALLLIFCLALIYLSANLKRLIYP